MTFLLIVYLSGDAAAHIMPSMQYCERIIAKIPPEKEVRLYCIGDAIRKDKA